MSADVLQLLGEIRDLLELRGENPFKVRAFDRALEKLAGRSDLLERAQAGTLTELEGIGKGIADIISEYLLQGTSSAREQLRAALPAGLVEFSRIPGVGPKKAALLIEELGIHTLGELEYACRENRLLLVKGFGEKLQQKVLAGISFLSASAGQQRLPEGLAIAERVLDALRAGRPHARVHETGELRRRRETLRELEFLVEGEPDPSLQERARAAAGGAGLPVVLFFAPSARYGTEWARTTGSSDHWKALGSPETLGCRDEDEFYAALSLPWIPPEMRETGEEVQLARSGALGNMLPEQALQGLFHMHTTRSDGHASLEEMVIAARGLGFSYLGVSDHSQSAFYARGLTESALDQQEREIRAIQEKYPDLRIFWGIESDILADGSLDYDDRTLRRFDFVIASVHSRFQGGRELLTERILRAIRHPATRFVGHLTGRILLGRPGYELDVEAVINEAANHDVAIEINSHPSRLDIDWRWGTALRAAGARVSINPDAHDTVGLGDWHYGVTMARKALLPGSSVINSRSAAEVEKWLKRR